MSRVGKVPVTIPPKVKVEVNGSVVKVEGPKGKLSRTFDRSVAIKVEGPAVKVTPAAETRIARAMWGTARSIIQGMIKGVVEPFKKDIEIQGVGFKAALAGNLINLSVGYSHPVQVLVPAGVTVEIDKTGTKLAIIGCDKHMVGQVAANIKSYRPAEPYKGKGVRIVGEFVQKKEGKKAG